MRGKERIKQTGRSDTVDDHKDVVAHKQGGYQISLVVYEPVHSDSIFLPFFLVQGHFETVAMQKSHLIPGKKGAEAQCHYHYDDVPNHITKS